jgi:RNA polymerase sigma-70 factor (ECF subfamily)
MVPPPSDEELMERYRDGDAAAFDVLYTRHRGPLYRSMLRQCRSNAEADELFQDVWMNLIRARERYRREAKFTTYLYHVAHNRLIDHYRRKPPLSPVSLDDEDAAIDPPAPASASPERQAELRQLTARALAALEGLPAPQREAFLLREEAGLTVPEIAEITGVDLEAAKSRLRYAIAKLREAVGDD